MSSGSGWRPSTQQLAIAVLGAFVLVALVPGYWLLNGDNETSLQILADIGEPVPDVDDAVFWDMCVMTGAWEEPGGAVSRHHVASGAWVRDSPLALFESISTVEPLDLPNIDGADIRVRRDAWENRLQFVQIGDQVSQRSGADVTRAAFRPLQQLQPDTSAQLVDLRITADRTQLLADIGISEIEPTTVNDGRGGTFDRYESLPVRLPRSRSVMRTFTQYGTSTPFVLDVWGDGNEVTRVRFMTQDLTAGYAEVRVGSESRHDATQAEFGCPTSFEPLSEGDWFGFEPWTSDMAVPLRVSLDEDGRPYEVDYYRDLIVRTEPLAEIVAPAGTVYVTDAGVAQYATAEASDSLESVAVTFRDQTERLGLSVLHDDATPASFVFGVRLDVPGSHVDRWEALQSTNGFTAGTGAIVTESVALWAQQNPGATALQELEGVGIEEEVITRDLDATPGLDFVLLPGTYGEGSWPTYQGFDSNGELVSLVAFDKYWNPWRLVIADGEPPAEITERIEQLEACMAGERPVRSDGECSYDS